MADASEEFRRVFTGALEEESGLELAAETGDGQETVRLAKELSPDIVVMDFVLARMDGLEVLSELAALPGRPRVLVLSSFARGNMAELAAAHGADYYMMKPCKLSAVMERIRQLSEGIASAFRGSAQMEELASAPPLQNDPALVEDMATLAETLLGREKVYRLKEGGMGSEDFASYTYELPCAYLLLGAGVPQEDPRYGQPMHNPKVVFNEDVLPLGAALLTAGAMHRLER